MLAYAVVGIAAVVFVMLFSRAVLYSPTDDLTVPVAHAAAPASNTVAVHPVAIAIPALHINTKIQEVGITKSGAMAVPTNFSDVGWYKYGTLPGQQGSAVLAGHVDDGLALPGVFSNLDKLKPGDTITITMSDKSVLNFVMTTSTVYDKNAKTNGIFSDMSGTYIKLITCTGTWLPSFHTHDKRLVITAALE